MRRVGCSADPDVVEFAEQTGRRGAGAIVVSSTTLGQPTTPCDFFVRFTKALRASAMSCGDFLACALDDGNDCSVKSSVGFAESVNGQSLRFALSHRHVVHFFLPSSHDLGQCGVEQIGVPFLPRNNRSTSLERL